MKGIPQSIRGRAWTYLSGANDVKAKAGGKDFATYYKPDRPDIIEVIERDIDRTYPEHIMFREVGNTGQKELAMLLKSYSFYNPEVGYCQGMGMVAGMIMMQAPTDVSSSSSVCLFFRTHNEKWMPSPLRTHSGSWPLCWSNPNI